MEGATGATPLLSDFSVSVSLRPGTSDFGHKATFSAIKNSDPKAAYVRTGSFVTVNYGQGNLTNLSDYASFVDRTFLFFRDELRLIPVS